MFEQPANKIADDDFERFVRTGGIKPPSGELIEAIRSGDRRKALTALRDYLAWELDGHRCSKCSMSQLRTGDTAALVLRLQKVMEEIEALPVEEDAEPDALEKIRRRRRRGDRSDER